MEKSGTTHILPHVSRLPVFRADILFLSRAVIAGVGWWLSDSSQRTAEVV